MIDTNLTIDGRRVSVSDAGLFTVSIGGEVLSSARFDGLQANIESHLADVAEKAEHQRRMAARRAAVKPTPVWARRDGWGHLERAVYRGRHATTGATLLTFADGTKPVGKKYYNLYVDVTQEQADAVNALLDRINDLDKQVNAAKGKAIDEGSRTKLSAFTRSGKVQVVYDKYSSKNRRDVTSIPFTANGKFLSLVLGEEVISGESVHDLETEVVRRLHPSYGQPVWIVDARKETLGEEPVAFLGEVDAHAPEGERYYTADVLAFEDRADAEEFLRLKTLRNETGEQFRAALAALPQLGGYEDDE